MCSRVAHLLLPFCSQLSIAPDPSNANAVSAQSLANSLVSQAASPTSKLAAALAPTAAVDTSFSGTTSTGAVYLCPDGSWQSTLLCLTWCVVLN